jgi:hypothetical protein
MFFSILGICLLLYEIAKGCFVLIALSFPVDVWKRRCCDLNIRNPQ